jgi:glycosyltransferase involved in cell wall biosynthesis
VIARSQAAHVYTLHEYFLACPTGGFYVHRAAEICTRRPLGLDCLTTSCDPRSNAHKAWRVFRQAVLRTAGGLPSSLKDIIYLAPEQRSIMAPHMAPDARWHYLPNAVGPRPPERVAAERNEPFLFIGRLSPEKGAEVAARAAKLAGVPIAFCGDGECQDDVRRANPDALMLGWLSPDELSDWMRKARCLVFPSLWYECYPLVVADALRVGLPVIVSKSSVATSSIADGVDGVHCAAGDATDWAEAMTRLKSNDFVRSLSEAAFQAGAQLRGYDEYTSRLIEIYEDVLARDHEARSAAWTLPA